MTLIFDLDETLVHCEHNQMGAYDKIVSINAPNGDKVKVRNKSIFETYFSRLGLKSDLILKDFLRI